jgi:hypothetical protein
MTSEQRAQLIRDRFLARRPSSRVVPAAKPKAVERPRVPYFNFSFGLLEREHWRQDWIGVADAQTTQTVRPERRRKGRNALERIAAHYPVRLAQSAISDETEGV